MKRIYIIEDYNKNTFIIRNKNEIKRIVQKMKIKSFNVEFINEFSINE